MQQYLNALLPTVETRSQFCEFWMFWTSILFKWIKHHSTNATFPSPVAFWYRTINQHLLINCYVFVPHIDKYGSALTAQGRGLLAAHRRCASFIRYSYQNTEHTWHTVLCRYMTTQSLQTRWSPRKSLNRLNLFVIKDAYFCWQSPAFFWNLARWYRNWLTLFVRCF